ncbi:MAG: retinol dehydrogenase [Isosphaeraceae bacterium]|jgi:NAD(P)-dependent dehydrogenase (short-subunit alcohol dehydrogenase family)|nr:MAG: retinol dehydrogenase [Isosphaeraceae bacterium]
MDSSATTPLQVLVTGATDGIGLVTARELARQGFRVAIVGRNPDKVERVAAALSQEPGAITPVLGFVADLSLVAEVKALAERVREAMPRLDVLVNNAGAMFLRREETSEGIEKTFALNHLAYFTLTNQLMDCLRAAGTARIVNVASDAHRAASGINFDDLQLRRRYSGWRAYCQSKLANILFTRELARRLNGTGITANCLHPGFVRTAFFNYRGLLGTLMRGFARVGAISPEQGARTTIYLATAPEVRDRTGSYFTKCAPVEPSPPARDDQTARRLWDLSEEMTGVGFTG